MKKAVAKSVFSAAAAFSHQNQEGRKGSCEELKKEHSPG